MDVLDAFKLWFMQGVICL